MLLECGSTEGDCALGTEFQRWKGSFTEYPKILHADHPLGEAFDIANEAQAEADAPKFVVASGQAVSAYRSALADFQGTYLQLAVGQYRGRDQALPGLTLYAPPVFPALRPDVRLSSRRAAPDC